MRYCFFIHGRWICVWVPIIVRPWWQDPNPPDPWMQLEEQPELGVDLRVLATIDNAARFASPELQGRLREVVGALTETLQARLPEGTELQASEAVA